MASIVARTATKQARPIISTSREEARRNVLRLYKAWHRQLLYISIYNFSVIFLSLQFLPASALMSDKQLLFLFTQYEIILST